VTCSCKGTSATKPNLEMNGDPEQSQRDVVSALEINEWRPRIIVGGGEGYDTLATCSLTLAANAPGSPPCSSSTFVLKSHHHTTWTLKVVPLSCEQKGFSQFTLFENNETTKSYHMPKKRGQVRDQDKKREKDITDTEKRSKKRVSDPLM
jgi:hypothetical protein